MGEFRATAGLLVRGALLVTLLITAGGCSGDGNESVASSTTPSSDRTSSPSAPNSSLANVSPSPSIGERPIACIDTCTGAIAFVHPTWGPSRLLTFLDVPSSLVTVPAQGSAPARSYTFTGPGSARLEVVDASGTLRWQHDIGDDEAEFAPAAVPVDAAGNIFIDYNPGRYNGVIVLRPVAAGMDDLGTLPGTNGDAFYGGEAVDTDGDGVFEVVVETNDCRPDCAGGTATLQTFRWNGVAFVSAGEPVQRCVPTEASTLLVVADDVRQTIKFDELIEVAQLNDIEILGELCLAGAVVGIGRFEYNYGEPAQYVLDHQPEYRSVKEACSDLASFAELASELAMQVVNSLPCVDVEQITDQDVSDLLAGVASRSLYGHFSEPFGAVTLHGTVTIVGISDAGGDGVAEAVVHRLGTSNDDSALFGDVVLYRTDRELPERIGRIGGGRGSGRATIDVDVTHSEVTLTDAVFDVAECCSGHIEQRTVELNAAGESLTVGTPRSWAMVDARGSDVPVRFLPGTDRATIVVHLGTDGSATVTFAANAGQRVVLDQFGPELPLQLTLADDSGPLTLDNADSAELPVGGTVSITFQGFNNTTQVINLIVD